MLRAFKITTRHRSLSDRMGSTVDDIGLLVIKPPNQITRNEKVEFKI